MKKQDSLLFSLPVTAALLIAGFAAFLYWQIANFEKGYLHDAQNNIAQEAKLASEAMLPMLKNNDFDQIKQFCDAVTGRENSNESCFFISSSPVSSDNRYHGSSQCTHFPMYQVSYEDSLFEHLQNAR